MQGIIVKLIFDKMLTIEMGDHLLIPCYSNSQRESLRVQLYRQKKEWEEQGYDNYDITISKVTNDEGIFLKVQKVRKIESLIHMKGDGEAVILPVKSESLDSECAIETPEGQDRIRKLMKEDGKTDEEIEEYFSSKTSNNDTS